MNTIIFNVKTYINFLSAYKNYTMIAVFFYFASLVTFYTTETPA